MQRKTKPRTNQWPAEILPVPSESDEQQWLFEWAKRQEKVYPGLELMYHIANEGKRSAAGGKSLVEQGLKKGVPDICLPVAKGGYHGMYVELKRTKGGRVGEEQEKWLSELKNQGYHTALCRGWEQAKNEIAAYMSGKRKREIK